MHKKLQVMSTQHFHTGYPETTNATEQQMQLKSTGGNRELIPGPVWEQPAVTDQTDPWQVVRRQAFKPYDCLLISVAFVVLWRVDCLWVRGVISGMLNCPSSVCIVWMIKPIPT